MGMGCRGSLATMLLMALPFASTGLAAPRDSSPQESAPATAAPPLGEISLQVRRSATSLDLVVEAVGTSPVLQQGSQGSTWLGELSTSQPGRLRVGPQRLSLPEAGLQSISLRGGGSNYQLEVVPMPGVPLARPVVSADGRNLIVSFAPPMPQPSLQTARVNAAAPGRVPQVQVAPPLQPRAVAPPLGDMAVGTMVLRNRSFLNISGPPVTMTIKGAPAKDVLMSLAQLGGYGFVYIDEDASAAAAPAGDAAGAAALSRPVSITFRSESYARAMNAVLLASGLQAQKEGNLIMAGKNVLSKSFGAQVSKIYRLNQASAASAANYLANLGAQINQTFVTTATSTQTESAGTPGANTANSTASTSTTTQIESYGASSGPLRGLIGTTDSRLSTVTLVGDSQLVAVAESYLRQIDLRQRQVALSVKILDVNLDNDTSVRNSFAFRYGNNFIVNDQGRLLAAFGGKLPPSEDQINTMSGSASSAKPEYTQDTVDPETGEVLRQRPQAPLAPAPVNPAAAGAYPPDQFFDFVRAQIESSSTKVLATPTLVLTENAEEIQGGSSGGGGGDASSVFSNGTIGRSKANESFVTVGTQVITDYTVQAGQNGAPNSCQPDFETAGLTFGARVAKIDDNGFVTFSMTPAISAVTRTQDIQGCGPVSVLSLRRLDTGSVRVRDGQTLILTGVISDQDAQVVRKWPILGDLPFVGQFFRGSAGQRKKSELVIMVTPRIIDDEQGGTYGYGYAPSTQDSRRFLGGSM